MMALPWTGVDSAPYIGRRRPLFDEARDQAPADSKPEGAPAANVFGQAQAQAAPQAAQQAGFDWRSAAPQRPAERRVEDSALVSRQLAGLLSSDSPLMSQARTRAAQQANARGLLNSSMAVGAAEGAVIDRALPIAQSDAGVFDRAAQYNTDQANTFARDENVFGRQASLANLSFDRQAQAQDKQLATTRDLNNDAQIRKIQDEYRAGSRASYDAYATEAQRIQESDMDSDVKQAQLAYLRNTYSARQGYLNTVYRLTPGWSSEWQQIALEFGG